MKDLMNPPRQFQADSRGPTDGARVRIMDRKTEWRRRLDAMLTNVTSQLKVDLYDNVVLPVVQDWFGSWDSLDQLNKSIENRLNEAWPTSQRKIEAAFLEFETSLKTELRKGREPGSSASLHLDEAEAQISTTVTHVVQAIVIVIAGSVAGGGGLALIHTGPVGWVIGAIIGSIMLFYGKEAVKEFVQDKVKHRQLPPLIKRPAKSKIATELKLNAPKFEEKLYATLKEQSAPLYEALEELNE
jgi:hypothetical protein